MCILDYQEFIIFSLFLCPRQFYNMCFVNSFCFLWNNFHCPHYLQIRKKIATLQSYPQRPSLGPSCCKLQCSFYLAHNFKCRPSKTRLQGGFLWLAALRNTIRIVSEQYPSLVVPKDCRKSLHNSHFHGTSFIYPVRGGHQDILFVLFWLSKTPLKLPSVVMKRECRKLIKMFYTLCIVLC